MSAYGHVELDSEGDLSQADQELNETPENLPHETYRPNTGTVLVPHEIYRPNDPQINVPHETYRPDNRKRTAEIVNSKVTLKKRVLNMAPDGTPVRLPSTAYLRTIPSPIIPAPHMLTFVQPDPAVLAMYLAADKKSK